MKYRFKRGCRKGLPKDLKRKTLRFKGRDTLRKKAPLPEPIEAIRLDDDKKRSLRLLAALKRFIYLIGAFFERLFSELRAAGLKFTDLIKKLGRLTTGFISKRLAARRVHTFRRSSLVLSRMRPYRVIRYIRPYAPLFKKLQIGKDTRS